MSFYPFPEQKTGVWLHAQREETHACPRRLLHPQLQPRPLDDDDPFLHVPEHPMSASLDDIDAMNYGRGAHRNPIYPAPYLNDLERYRRMQHRRRCDSPPRD
ncbi:hypothetical protein VTN02DRAFT_4474 [Thermoascus thermophilus]